jgi:uncharacterized protein (DUF1800 family)
MRKTQNWTLIGLIFAAGGIVTAILLLPASLHAAVPTTAPTTAPANDSPAIIANQTPWTRDDAAHLLRRAGFGGTPEQIDKLQALGRDGAVDYLLTGQPADAAIFPSANLEDFKPTPVPEPDPNLVAKAQAGLALRRSLIAQAPTTQPSTTQPSATQPTAAAVTIQEAQSAIQTLQQQARRVQQQDLQRLRIWWIDRMVRTDRPLEEKMTLFWHGLFTSGAREVRSPTYLVDQNVLFHHEALGNYKQLTHDVIHGAAMLTYLNNDQNVRGRPNENLAREMMELFTMGEGQGYTETDIKNIARALTGLGPTRGRRFGGGDEVVAMRPRAHDEGEKTIFGKTGNFGPDDVVDLIFAQPQPARYLARKLWQFYACPDPSDSDLAPVITALQESKYELKPALRAMFTSPQFYSPQAKFALIKSPTELAVEELRTLGVTPSDVEEAGIGRQLKAMDQELFQPPNVRGWVGGDNWITAATLYTRYNTASAAVNGSLRFAGAGGGRFNFNGRQARPVQNGPSAVEPVKLFASLGTMATPTTVVDAAIDRFLQRPLQPDKREALLDVIGVEPVKLGEPQSDERVREMICLLMSTPEYQVH